VEPALSVDIGAKVEALRQTLKRVGGLLVFAVFLLVLK
jgi:hypothetical protein